MADTNFPSDDPLNAFRALEPDFVADAAHEALLQAEIRRTLETKAKGRMTYRTLDEVARKFGADAR